MEAHYAYYVTVCIISGLPYAGTDKAQADFWPMRAEPLDVMMYTQMFCHLRARTWILASTRTEHLGFKLEASDAYLSKKGSIGERDVCHVKTHEFSLIIVAHIRYKDSSISSSSCNKHSNMTQETCFYAGAVCWRLCHLHA